MATDKEDLENSTTLQDPSVIYEDEDAIVLNKPAGLIVHSDGKTKDKTLCDWIVSKYPHVAGVGEPLNLSDGRVIDRPGIVHRLDRETSGVMVVAKNQKSFLFLKDQFMGRDVKKEYVAYVLGRVKEDFGTIDAPLGRSKGDFRQYTTPARARGEMREAVTYFEVLKRGAEFTFVKCLPKTGRTHQIRAHMKSIGHGIVCDRVYSGVNSCALGFNRVALHAKSLTISLPNLGERSFEAPLPEDFARASGLMK